MTNQAILTKAIEKAIAGGWKATLKFGILFMQIAGEPYQFQLNQDATLPFVIFNHDFAKALWGEEETELWFDDHDLQDGQPLLGGSVSYPYDEGAAVGFKTKAWQYHLQQMVIANDPIKYLGDSI